jgi:hypothetical protein
MLVPIRTMTMEVVRPFGTSINFYQTTRRNIPEDSHLHTPHEKLKSHQKIIILLLPGALFPTITCRTHWQASADQGTGAVRCQAARCPHASVSSSKHVHCNFSVVHIRQNRMTPLQATTRHEAGLVLASEQAQRAEVRCKTAPVITHPASHLTDWYRAARDTRGQRKGKANPAL